MQCQAIRDGCNLFRCIQIFQTVPTHASYWLLTRLFLLVSRVWFCGECISDSCSLITVWLFHWLACASILLVGSKYFIVNNKPGVARLTSLRVDFPLRKPCYHISLKWRFSVVWSVTPDIWYWICFESKLLLETLKVSRSAARISHSIGCRSLTAVDRFIFKLLLIFTYFYPCLTFRSFKPQG